MMNGEKDAKTKTECIGENITTEKVITKEYFFSSVECRKPQQNTAYI
jgi:hypothetical protein